MGSWANIDGITWPIIKLEYNLSADSAIIDLRRKWNGQRILGRTRRMEKGKWGGGEEEMKLLSYRHCE